MPARFLYLTLLLQNHTHPDGPPGSRNERVEGPCVGVAVQTQNKESNPWLMFP